MAQANDVRASRELTGRIRHRDWCLTRSITVDAPVDRVFDYALDVTKLWKAKDVGLAEVVLKPGGVGTSARLYSHFLGFHIEGGLEYTEVVPEKRIVAQVHFFMENPTWTFTFGPVKAARG